MASHPLHLPSFRLCLDKLQGGPQMAAPQTAAATSSRTSYTV